MRYTQGTTPAGGDHAVATFYRLDGSETDDPAEAATGEVTEYGDGMPIARTYLDTSSGPTVPQYTDPGMSLAEGEWTDTLTHHTFDIYLMGDDGRPRVPQTREELVEAVGLTGWPLNLQRQSVGQMMAMPWWPDAPEPLRNEVSAWLVATRPQQD